MLSGEFERKLRKLNKRLRVFCSSDDSRPAGVWYLAKNGEYVEICGIDKNYVPERSTLNEQGFRIKGGWRRVIITLIKKDLCDRADAERIFRTHFYMAPKRRKTEDTRAKSIEQVLNKHNVKHEGVVYE